MFIDVENELTIVDYCWVVIFSNGFRDIIGISKKSSLNYLNK